MVSRKAILSVMVAGVYFLNGCAAFKANNLPKVTPNDMDIHRENKLKVYSTWKIASKSMTEDDKAFASVTNKILFDESLKKTNCCIIVESTNEADIIVNGVTYQKDWPWYFFTGHLEIYFILIPIWFSPKFHIWAEVSRGQTTYLYDLNDKVVIVKWLPMIFLAPFAPPKSVLQEVADNTFASLIVKMKNDGVFE